MKLIDVIPMIAIIVFLSVPARAESFEGTISMRETADGEIATHKLSFKGEKLRMEEVGPDADGSVMILDAKNLESFIVDPDEKPYFPFPWISQTPEELKEESEEVVVTKTGKTAKVAGHGCDLYLERNKRDGSTTELCVARGLGNDAMFGLTNSEAALALFFPPWLRDMVKGGAFPLRGIDRDRTGKEISRVEATKVEAKRLDDHLFVPPPGYRRMNIEEVGRGRTGQGEAHPPKGERSQPVPTHPRQ
jgi:hypothetical protein